MSEFDAEGVIQTSSGESFIVEQAGGMAAAWKRVWPSGKIPLQV